VTASLNEVPAPCEVTEVLYKLNGVSQPSLVAAADGNLYVAKFRGFPGTHGVANEVIGTEVVRRLGLPVPEWRPLSFSREILDRHPELWYRNGNTSIRPESGLHFGSRLLMPERGRVYQVIPRIWWRRVENCADWAALLMIDLWINDCDRRQAVFVPGAGRRGLRAVFIDYDSAFGGRFGNEETTPRMAMTYDLTPYEETWTEKLSRHWLGAINGLSDDWLAEAVSSVPEGWASSGMLEEKLWQLHARRRRLASMVGDVRQVLDTSYSIKLENATGATRPRYLAD
jgi:hypothetical protein